MFLKNKIYKFTSIIFYYFFLFISNFVKIRFLQIETRRLGHMSEPIEIHLIEKKKITNTNKKYLDIYFPEKFISNLYLWSKWCKVLRIKSSYKILRFVCEPIFKIALKKNTKDLLIPFRHNSKTNDGTKKDIIWQTHDIHNVLSSHPPNINFDNDEHEYAKKLLDKKNIIKGDKIILFTIRDVAYFEKLYFKNIEMNKHRNTRNINIYSDLIDNLCKRGFKVIRMGKIVKEKVEYSHSNFFDYAVSDIKCDFLDIYLFSISNFIISNGTGLDSVASLFRKKILFLNYGELTPFTTYFNSNVAFIYPRNFIYNNEKKLNLIDIYQKNIITFTSDNDFQTNKITFDDLTSNQQIQAVDEMINYMNYGYSSENLNLNKKFFEILKRKFNQKHIINFSTKYLKENNLIFNQ